MNSKQTVRFEWTLQRLLRNASRHAPNTSISKCCQRNHAPMGHDGFTELQAHMVSDFMRSVMLPVSM